jgi:16S rRNA (guanine527-N7)-methyltransferase
VLFRSEELSLLADVVVSRAFASLADFVQISRHLLKPEGVWLAMKGQDPQDEIKALPADTEVFHVKPLPVPGLYAERCLVWMRPISMPPF